MRDETLAIEEVPAPTGQRVLRLTGPLVLNSFFAFQTMVREDETRLLVLDFSAVPYIDSAGIGAWWVLMYIAKKMDGSSCWQESHRGCAPH